MTEYKGILEVNSNEMLAGKYICVHIYNHVSVDTLVYL